MSESATYLDERAVEMAAEFLRDERHSTMDNHQRAHALLSRLYHNGLIEFREVAQDDGADNPNGTESK